MPDPDATSPKSAHSSRTRSRRFAVALPVWLSMAAMGVAQSHEVLHDGIVRVGNRWQFDSLHNGSPYVTTWEFFAGEQVGGQNTLVLRESASPFYIDDMNVFLDDTALTVNRLFTTEFSPLTHTLGTFTDALEKIPRFVNESDAVRQFGTGNWISQVQENPALRWTRIQDQFVTFAGIQTISSVFGPIECVVFRIDEVSRFDNDWRETAQRVYCFSRSIGPISMDYGIQRYDQFNQLVSNDFISHRLRFFVSAAPDLVLGDGASFTPTSVRTGEEITVSWSEFSVYRNVTTTHTTTVYLTTDKTISGDDYRLVDKEVPAIAANQSVNLTETLPMPASVPSGDYNVALVLDSPDEIDELSENNTYFIDGTSLTVQSEPDLTVKSGSFTPEAIIPGETLEVTATVINAGGVTVPPVWVHVYLSVDTVIDSTDYPLITGIQTPELGALAEYTFTKTAFVPLGFAERSYVVGVEVDVLDAVAEANETNNAVALPQLLLVGRPDLRVSSGWFSPAAVRAGQSIHVQATVENVGPRKAAGNWIHVYLSPDATITQSDILLQSGLRAPELEPGEGITVNADPIIPLTTPLSTYYIGVIADILDEINEIDEANNARAIGSGTLLVTTPPDLTAHHLDFAPGVLNAGGPISLGGFVQNISGAPTTETFWVEFYVSPNADFSPPRHFLCDSALMPALGIGGQFSLNSLQRTVYPSVPPGEYTFGIIIDRANQIPESNETNNTVWVADRRLGIGQQPTRATRWQLYR